MNIPLVSGIIIFLNAETFLQEAIESVLAQTYKHWELLLVDDGSTDGSTQIARRYAQEHPGKVFYLEHENHQNRGMSASRNLGLAHAHGTYVGFLDADDLWLPYKLEQQVAILETHSQAAMVYGRTQIWHSWSGAPADARRDHFYDLGVEPNKLIAPPQLLILQLQNQAQTPTTCNALMRRDVVARVGGFEDSFRGMYEDQVFFAKINLASHVFVSDTCWAKYRQHPESCSSEAESASAYYRTRLPFLTWLEAYLLEHNCQHTEVWQALKHELWACRHPLQRQLLQQGTTVGRRLRKLARLAT